MSRNKYPEETESLILDVAQRLFIEKGYERTTIQDIIDNLGGLTKGAVYHHFKSKEDILSAVSNRLFASNTLSARWRQIKESGTMSGAEKIKRMLAAALTDGQEAEFRKMGVHFQNIPQMLSELLLRSVNDIAANDFLPVIEEGIEDGSIITDYPRQMAEIIALMANIWINPLVFPVSEKELRMKFDAACCMTKTMGIDISDIYPALDSMRKEISD
ncbi:MAG: TetR/AcrR family transcriptional regulator [Treponema sp.]|nr:TetR/AcrR family transcriptional regulator [Treponema sp.]